MVDQIKLYWHTFSIIPWRVRIMLEEKGVEYDDEQVDLYTQEPTAEFLKLNPFAQIPVIEQGAFVLSESLAILEYLEESYPHPPLLPTGLRERALVRQLMCWGTDYWPPAWKKWMSPRLHAAIADQWTEETVASGRRDIAKHLDVIDAQLGEGDWLVADYSLADICYAPMVLVLESVDLGEEVAQRPRVQAWINRLRERPAIRKTMMPGI